MWHTRLRLHSHAVLGFIMYIWIKTLLTCSSAILEVFCNLMMVLLNARCISSICLRYLGDRKADHRMSVCKQHTIGTTCYWSCILGYIHVLEWIIVFFLYKSCKEVWGQYQNLFKTGIAGAILCARGVTSGWAPPSICCWATCSSPGLWFYC